MTSSMTSKLRTERIFNHLVSTTSASASSSPLLVLHLQHHHHHHSRRSLTTSPTSSSSSSSSPTQKTITIGDVSARVASPSNVSSHRVPALYADEDEDTQETLRHLRWMLQKHALRQDVFLIGPPGPARRRLAMAFAELLELDTEYLAITRDTTESDLKQRREIVHGNVEYVDQAPVSAAVYGRLLIIDGIEKAERNVLPTLNNLLENREMSLDDGRFLVNPDRYDSLLKDGDLSGDSLAHHRLVPVHRNFRVIALGLPVPRFPGYILDPPLRSRFQALNVAPMALHSHLRRVGLHYPLVPVDIQRAVVSFHETVKAIDAHTHQNRRFSPKKIPLLSTAALDHVFDVLSLFADGGGEDGGGGGGGEGMIRALFTSVLFERVYPFVVLDASQIDTIIDAFHRFKIPLASVHAALDKKTTVAAAAAAAHQPQDDATMMMSVVGIDTVPGQCDRLMVHLCMNGMTASVRVYAGGTAGGTTAGTGPSSSSWIHTPLFDHLLSGMIQDHAVGRDICIVGPKGAGKSAIVRQFCARLGYGAVCTQMVHLYRDMSSRDLLQRRTTDSSGNTQWELTPLVRACLHGHVAVLDGLDRLPSSTLSALQSLLHDREVRLFDGTRLLRHDRFDRLLSLPEHTDESLRAQGILRIHPAFRVVALALVGDAKKEPWLIEETLTLFSFHVVQNVTAPAHLLSILTPMFAPLHTPVATITCLVRMNPRMHSIAPELALSLRQFMRVLRRYARYPDVRDLRRNIERVLLFTFLPQAVRQAVEECLNDVCACISAADGSGGGGSSVQLRAASDDVDAAPLVAEYVTRRSSDGEQQQMLRVGDVVYPVSVPRRPELVPVIYFVDIQDHLRVLQGLLMDLTTGEHHILLIGNQGVGKNKIADRLLQLLRLEREYMQLHRDTTVQQLTVTPSLRAGVMVYENSALVNAVIEGRVLVVDEADKAPLEVVSILKGLVEDGHMSLSDGRRIVRATADDDNSSANDDPSVIRMHPSFRVIVLANRPGYPFLGNDFFRECGDVFSCHIVDNPDRDSEMELLRAYGPDVEEWIVHKLVDVFGSLRRQVEEGVFTYPYSTRELVHIVKHLQRFPADGLLVALENVLHFDVYDSEVLINLQATFRDHGLPLTLARYDESNNSTTASSVVDLATAQPLPPPTKWRIDKSGGDAATAAAVTTLTSSTSTATTPPLPSRRKLHMHPTSSSSSMPLMMSQVSVSERDLFRECREWDLDLGRLATVDTWRNERFDRFSEQKCSWKVASDQSARVLGMVTLNDDSVHVLQDSPLTLLSFDHGTQYRRYSRLHLDDFLPVIASDTNSILLRALPSTGQLVVYVPFHVVMLVVTPRPAAATETSKHSFAHVRMVSLPSLATSGADSSSSAQFMKYMSPGFKMPRTFFGGGTNGASSKHRRGRVVVNNTLMGDDNVMVAYHVGDSSFSVFDFHHRTLTQVVFPSADGCVGDVTPFSRTEWYVKLLPADRNEGDDDRDGGRVYVSRGATFSFVPVVDAARLPRSDVGVHRGVQSRYVGRGTAWMNVNSEKTLLELGITHTTHDNQHAEHLVQSLIQPTSPPATTAGAWRAVSSAFVEQCQQLVVTTSLAQKPFLSVVDFTEHTIRHVGVPDTKNDDDLASAAAAAGTSQSLATMKRARHMPPSAVGNSSGSSSVVSTNGVVSTAVLQGTADIVTMQEDGTIRVWQVDRTALERDVESWRRLFGVRHTDTHLRMEIASDRRKDATAPKHGKRDAKNEPHVGGNQWAGGSGGADTAGMGGKGGPYRLDSGHDVHQMADEEKAKVSEEILAAARAIAERELAARLKEIDLSTDEDSAYRSFLGRVSKEVTQLRVILESVEARAKEREWLRHQMDGDIDDSKLVDGVTGDKQIYRRRGVASQKYGLQQRLPKRLHFLLDISGSMYRFNGYDHRLDRCLETALLIMESLDGFDHKYSYTLVGHSGDSPRTVLVPYGSPPLNRKERLKVLMRMHAHSQYCASGDHTVESVVAGLQDVVEEDADEHVLFLISDANLRRYGINPAELQRLLTSHPSVSAFCVFIASLNDEATQITKQMQPNHAFVCEDVGDMPHIFQQIFSSLIAKDV